MAQSVAMQARELLFRASGDAEPYFVRVDQAAVAVMLEAASAAGKRETGGILIGRYLTDGWSVDVDEATPKPLGSSAGWWWFQRGNHGLQELLALRWSSGLHYVGEWHFHPGAAPEPSGADRRAMKKIANDPLYQCSSPLLIIIGGKPGSAWSASASLARPEQALLRLDDVPLHDAPVIVKLNENP